MEEIVSLTGKFTYILFQNETNFYTVAKFEVNDENERKLTVTGTLPEIELDVLYHISGHYTEHPRYGMQFVVDAYEKPLPNERAGIIRYLSSVQFQGIGKKTAESIVEALGENCLTKIKENPDVLTFVPNLSEKQVASIKEGIMQEEEGMAELVRFLNVHGIGIRNLVRLNKAYGKEALRKIQENPYRVITECDGFGFATADKMAQALGFQADDERRLYAYMISLCMDLCMQSGNTYVPYDTFKQVFLQKIAPIPCDFDAILNKVIQSDSLKQEQDRIYPISQYEAECTIANYLNNFPYKSLEPYDPSLFNQYLEAMQKDIGITYDTIQKDAIQAFFDHPFFILTGGPGTGKTTVVRALVNLFHLLYPNTEIVCAAPTGRAAKRLAELTHTQASTIHSLLQWDLEANVFNKNEEEPINADLLIIDEFSMVDSYLFANLLKASRNVKKICIIGDEDQLPSVGPGSVLRDLVACEQFPTIRLKEIYRQKTGSDVIALAHDLKNGAVDLKQYAGDVAFFDANPSQIKNTIVSIVRSALEQGYQMDDIQVLSPMYNGSAGIDVLNHALQESFNPPDTYKNEVKNGYMIFRENDKILQLKNQPDDDVYNGDIGVLEEIIDAKHSETKKTTLIVNFDGNYVEYTPENWMNITLAYCISVHKSQGSEYPIIIMPFVTQHTIMLTKKLIYTAITRAKKALIMLGDRNAFQRGISDQQHTPERLTTLEMRLRL